MIKDKTTGIIVWYLESVSDGKKLIKLLKNNKKPIIAIKAGKTEVGKSAVKTHTGSIAGNYISYHATFRKYNVIECEDIEEIFNYLIMFKNNSIEGKRIGVITNGGGLGVITADLLEKHGLMLGGLSKKAVEELKKHMPPYINPTNPLDVGGDSDEERYVKGMEVLIKENDALIVNILPQSPYITESLLTKINVIHQTYKKPIVLVIPGGKLARLLQEMAITKNIACYRSINSAVKALKVFIEFHEKYSNR